MSNVPESNSERSDENENLNEDLEVLEEIVPPATLSLASNSNQEANKDAKAEREFFKTHKQRMEELRADGLEQDIKERRLYADKIYKLLSRWLVAVFAVIVFQGFSSESSSVKFVLKKAPNSPKSFVFQPKFILSDKVLLALIGGTTLNVIGIFVIVANYLFPKFPNHSDNKIESEDKNKA